MGRPYTTQPLDAYLIAQLSIAATLTALLWNRRIRPWPAQLLLLAALWLAALSPIVPDVLHGFFSLTVAPSPLFRLTVAASLATLAMAMAPPHWPGVVALLGQIALHYVGTVLVDSDLELTALHTIWIGALVGLSYAVTARPLSAPPPARVSYARHDAAIFLLGFLACVAMSWFVFGRGTDSDDEWSYTYQADLLAHFKAFAAMPPCADAHRAYWVFYDEGRAFSQYPPGWPLFMVPFARVGAAWLSTPVAHGLLAVGVARLARRAMRAASSVFDPAPERVVKAAGVLAAMAATLGAAQLMNGGSRFAHTFVGTTTVWMIEAACVLASKETRARGAWGALLGACAALALATRPADGATLGLPIFLYVAWSLARGRIGWRATAFAAGAFAFFAGLTLVVLRLQLGKWFTTGYSLAGSYYAWAEPRYSVPLPAQWKYNIPLAHEAYMFFPCAAAIGWVGLLPVRARERRVVFMLVAGFFAHLAIYTAIEFNRFSDFGYGPRFHLSDCVCFSVGTGVALAPLFARGAAASLAAPRLFARLAPGVAALAIASGVLRIAYLVYPPAHAEVHARNAVYRAARAAHLENAVVVAPRGAIWPEPLDVTENDPADPDPKVLFFGDVSPQQTQCLHDVYKTRRFYRATGKEEVTLTPE